MQIVLTGITGFIGSRLARRLASEHRLYAIVRHDPPWPMTGVSYVTVDLKAAGVLEGAVAKGRLPAQADVVVHLATSRRHREFPTAAPDLFQVNVGAAAVLLDYARRAGAQQFILGSTGTVYEPYAADPLAEDQPVAPTSFFAATKVAVEYLMRCYEPFLVPLSLRMFFPYGPGQTDRLIPRLVDAVKSGRPVRLPAEGEGIRFTPTFIDDIVDVLTEAMRERWGGIFNVAAPKLFSLQQLVNKVCVLTGRPANFVRDPLIAGPLIRPDLRRLASRMSIDRFVGLETGIQRMIDTAECTASA